MLQSGIEEMLQVLPTTLPGIISTVHCSGSLGMRPTAGYALALSTWRMT